MLGRDTLLRKTMLDECKGERLEEVLAYFSTAVLRKVVGDGIYGRNRTMPVAVDLAFQSRGYKAEKMELNMVALAHKASLRRLLERKDEANARYRDFADLLGVKERNIARRSEALRAKERSDDDSMAVSDAARSEMRRTLRNNWSGSDNWIEALLFGDAAAEAGGLMGTHFERVWRRVQQGRLGELEAEGVGLLQQLEGRVKVQRERLDKWDAFRRDMFRGSSAMTSPSKPRTQKTKTRGINLKFEAHQDLQVGNLRTTIAVQSQGPKMNDDYTRLVEDLQNDLVKLKKKEPVNFAALTEGRRGVMQSTRVVSNSSTEGYNGDGTISEISDLEDDGDEIFSSKAPVSSFQAKLAGAKRPSVRPKVPPAMSSSRLSMAGLSGPKQSAPAPPLKSEPEPELAPAPVSAPNFPGRSSYDIDRFDLPAEPTAYKPIPPIPKAKPRKLPPLNTKPVQDPEPISLPGHDISPTQDLADQILDTMDNASPSPLKRSKPRHTLSLAERTRLSIVRKSSRIFEDEDLDRSPPSVNVSGPTATAAAATVEKAVSTNSKREEVAAEPLDDLVSRTRRSMVGLEKAQQKAQLDRRRSLRRSKALPPPRRDGSYFPKLEEDPEEGERLAELLLAQEEQDMEAVFKSRPKIRGSPNPSPTKDWSVDEYT